MIIAKQEEVSDAVLAELARSPDERFKQIMSVKHLHAFVRETKLTETEFQNACAVIAKLGQFSTPWHNEVVLMAGTLGISSLICLITAGDPIFVDGGVQDLEGRPVEGAQVYVWHTSAQGFYENQDPSQADMNLLGKLITDKDGHIWFHSIKPAGYPIPINGPVGDLLRAQGRHNMRPAHIHFLIYKEGYKTQFSQVYSIASLIERKQTSFSGLYTSKQRADSSARHLFSLNLKEVTVV